jgi:hypothetical protein
MVNFGFWNVNALWNLEEDRRDIPRVVADFATERTLDVLFLIECRVPHFSRSLREVGFLADTLPTLSSALSNFLLPPSPIVDPNQSAVSNAVTTA